MATPTIRASNIYVSAQLQRWLKWIADLRAQGGTNHTPDTIAEEMLRSVILSQMPDIEAVESDYWQARHKLDAEAVEKIKAATHEPA